MTISVSEAAARIRAGELAAFPTETVYGLGANALNEAAVRKIYQLKGRPETSPLIVHVATAEMARQVVAEWPPLAQELADRWWPGPLTLVLPKNTCVPDLVTAGLGTVGVRVPRHPVALELIEKAGVPIAAPSANRFMGLSPTSAAHVTAAFGDQVPVVDGGPCEVGIESTVVAIEGGKLTLLRPGMVAFADIEQAAVENAAHPAPGMHERHYSPKTPLLLIDDPADLPGAGGAYLWREKPGTAARSIQMPLDPAAYAGRLYGILHELDAERLAWIAVETPPQSPAWAGILDRLRRAACRKR